MIGKLSGIVDSKLKDGIILQVLGIGFIVNITNKLSTKFKIAENISLFIECKFKEDSVNMFGFTSLQEKECFCQLTKVRGISGKYAMRIMNALSVDELAKAISSANITLLATIPGIGRKTASRLVSDIGDNMDLGFLNNITEHNNIVNDAVGALNSLGHSIADAQKVVQNIYNNNKSITLEELISKSLSMMSCS
ncbi:Holliday junction ATP-dependent DNA helicase RuvA [Candidatus Xenohaliotis californiensis]|uniref:Holliday junction branch migration complex subunit RuvA n=1 Tax=Candidatus Xenohaliotis californiensis TaxID=84677 RepID=A0ABP0EWG7_9RICK|nr:Holliday junction ATP-dependent DNA helicase RuvA [Candidatus Xenohaliotis californiensis]